MTKLREFERLKERILELAAELSREKFLVEQGEGNPEKVKEVEERLGFNFSEINKLMSDPYFDKFTVEKLG